MKTIEELINLTPEQEQLCKEMESLYERMQQAGIAFAVNENGQVVVYNATEIADCTDRPLLSSAPEGYEEVYVEDMRELFPLWVCDTLCLKRK